MGPFFIVGESQDLKNTVMNKVFGYVFKCKNPSRS